ncbi:MAG: carboxypeptidase regulatory-like domain-containing protein [Jatrophihabitantaceae bacterium]
MFGTGALTQAGPAAAAPPTPAHTTGHAAAHATGHTPAHAAGHATPARPTPHTSAATKATHPVRNSCDAVTRTAQARCFALVRTDLASLGRAVNPADTPAGYGPSDLQDAYNLPSATAGAGQTVAIVDAFDDPNAESDLAAYRTQYGLSACTTDNGCFSKVNQQGAASPLPGPDAGWAEEISLDLDMVSAACPQCHILLVEADDNYTNNLAAAVDTAVALGAKYVSNSYGGPEDPSETEFDADYNHPGVVVTASTGDDGYGSAYPATAPGVTAVGGTSLTADSSARGWTESAWAGAGSGCSDVEAKPDFQTDPGCPGRSIADVSSVADPETGVAVYDSYNFQGWAVFGGTSASSPMIAATYALAGTPAANTDPASYPYQAAGQLNDVTTGNNGSCDPSYLCTAGPGYDGPTGLGTPNGVGAFRLGPHGTVSGTVTDAKTGAPLAGAKITAGDASAVSAADGTYTLSVATGTYDVVASAYGYATLTRTSIVVGDGQSVTESFALVPVPSVSVSGTVTDGSGHHWPVYAKVSVAGVPGAPTYTDPFTGHYVLTLPSRNTYSVTVTPAYPGYTPSTVSVKLGVADSVKNVAVKVDATSCAAPGYTTKYTGVSENFDSGIPSTWTVKDDNGSGGVWTTDDAGARGNLTGGSGKFAIIDSDHLGIGNSQDTELISPVVDLSKDTSPVVGLASDYKAFSNSVADIDYTVDGGTTWANVSHLTTTSQQGPLEIALPGAAGQKAVQVRFHYTGSWAYYWEVDNVFVGHKSCAVVPGGLVAGFTKDGNTKQAITGASVTSVDAPADSGVSATTPDDPAQPDGLYWLFSSKTGTHKFTAAKSKYQSQTKNVAVASNFITRKDFSLAAGQVATSPAALSGTVTLGGSTDATMTLTNTGTVAAHVKLAEQDGGFQIAGRPASEVYAKQKGAPVRNVPGHYSALRLKPTKSVAKPDAQIPSAAPWQSVADYPTPISNNSASSHDGLLYSLGGFDGNDDVKTFYAYDPTATTWSRLSDMSVTREAPVSAWINGKLYVTGGWGADLNPTGVTEAYDPAAGSWTTLSANPRPHAGSGTAVLDGKLYVIGGCTANSCGVKDVQVYDPSDDSWTAGTDYPDAIAWQACGAVGGQIDCAGGTNDSGTSSKTYSFDGTTWSPAADLPADAWGSASSVANGQLLVSGGVINNSSSVTNEGWSFDPAAGAWTALPNSNNSYYRLGGACGFYKVGGSVSNVDPAHADVEVLPGYDSCDSGSADVPWLSESQTETDLAPGASVDVTVSMDSSMLTQPGEYDASIDVSTDTPYPPASVPVTFTVKPPKTWAKIAGVVSGQPCTGSAAPLAGATVEVDSWAASYTLSTDKDGRYALWLDRRSNPLTLIAAKDGWAPQTRTVRITPGNPLTSNFTLKPAKACK